MWICQRCYTENRDSSNVCAGCGAPRAAGRFGSAPQQRPSQPSQPPVVSVPGVQQEPAPVSRPSRNGYQMPETGVRPQKEKKKAFVPRLAGFVGVLLMVLLPVLTALLAWRQHDTLSKALVPLLLGNGRAEWIGIVVYCVLSLIAVLLSVLPGLWTLLLARPGKDR